MLRASSLGLLERLSQRTIRRLVPCFVTRNAVVESLTFMPLEPSASRPFSHFDHSHVRPGRDHKPDQGVATGFSKDECVRHGDGETMARGEGGDSILQPTSVEHPIRQGQDDFSPVGQLLHQDQRRRSHTPPKGENTVIAHQLRPHEPLSHAERYIAQVPYPAGLPWRPFSIKNLEVSKLSRLNFTIDMEVWRDRFLRELATTQSVPEAWEAYSTLLDIPHDRAVGEPHIPFAHMHRLFRVVARHRPKTRRQARRLISVANAIRAAGGEIKLHEWNALIDAAGKGWRRTHVDDFQASLSMFQDMISGRAPGTTIAGETETGSSPPVTPDIYTYTILIDAAARTLHAPSFRHATSLLAASGLPPTRITHLSLLKYFTYTKQLSGVRSTLLKMQEQNLELGLDGINACLWSYSFNGRLDLVMMIYRLFRHNMSPETYVGERDVASIARRLRDEEYITIAPNIKPNEITFNTVIQTQAHHGNLLGSLTVLMEMLSVPNLQYGAPLAPDENGDLQPGFYSPTLPAFRALFIGFTRHGLRPRKNGTAVPRFQLTNPPGEPAWVLTSLEKVFDAFLLLPEHTVINRGLVYWTIVAFEKTSGGDTILLRQVWNRIHARFNIPWFGPGNRLWRLHSKLFPEESHIAEKHRHKL